MNTDATAKAGTLLSFESGCYSDHILHGFFVVLKDFVPHAEALKFASSDPKQRRSYGFSDEGFLAHLIAQGLLLEVPYGELHSSDYGTVDEFRFTPISEKATA